MLETYLIIFRDIELRCQVEFCPPHKLAQFYSVEGINRIPVCDLRQTGVAPATFSLWSTGGQSADLESLQKVLRLAAILMKSWNANDGKTFKEIFPGVRYELSKL